MSDPETIALPTSDPDRVAVECPYCGEIHTHGALETHEQTSHRISHCNGKPRGGYWIRRSMHAIT